MPAARAIARLGASAPGMWFARAVVLPELTAEDLIAIGVTSVGHRRKLLAAIAALRDGAASARDRAAETTPSLARASVATPRLPEAERRQLTVLFCDLAGSTALASKLDPEDMGAVIRAYQDACAGVITRFDGHVAKYMGDGVLAYFGWPVAHEDEAERAVRAGLALVEAVGRLSPSAGEPLACRVGLATGVVVVGELVGEGAAREQTVVGETPNLAARLQALAEPNAVIISPRTRRLVGSLFELQDLGGRALKGFAEPVRAWRVIRAGNAESRFEAMRSAGLTPLVGREHELALFLDRFELAKGGEGQVVLLAGEAGIGKSRLVQALREGLGGEPHTPLSHFCSPYHTSSVLHPVIDLLARAAGFEREDPPERQLDKLEALLALAAEDVREAAPLLADLLAIPTGDRYPPLNHSPQQKKEKTLQALLAQLAGLAARKPTLVLWEDVHWIDPTSLELLGRAIERVQRLSVLMVITFRPEFSPPWTGHGHVTALSLSRLSRRQGAAMALRLSGGKPLPAEVVEQITAKTDGVPLFVEELTKAVLESGLLRDAGDRYELAGPLLPLAIPATLQDSLMARLDRLGRVKEVAQIGAVIGREFSHELLAAVAPLREDELRGALDRLMASELVFRRGAPPDASYVFKHALVQDVAYASLLRSRRQQLHARIAAVLAERFPETATMAPELLAHHCAQAGLVEKAVMYRYRAGQRALARSALAEAVAQLRQGLELLESFPGGPERRRRELDLQVALGSALIAARGYGAPETGRAFARARELCREEGDVQRLLPVLNGQVLFHNQRAEPHAAHAIAAEMLAVARPCGDTALLIPAHRALSLTSLHLGRFAAAREHAEEVLALYDPARHRALASRYTFDQRVVALGYLHAALFALGYPDQARVRCREQLAEAQQLAHPSTLAQALQFTCIFHRVAGELEALQRAAEALVAVATEHGLPHFLAQGRVARGWALTKQGKTEEGITEFKKALAAFQASGERLPLAYVSGLLAEAYVSAGRHRDALSYAAEARAWTGRGSHWFEVDRHDRSGRLLLSSPEPNKAEAEACFRRAFEVARAQDAKMWELHAATSLARLWRDQGRLTEARDLLAPVYSWFTEGFDTPDLKDAKALLDRLQ